MSGTGFGPWTILASLALCLITGCGGSTSQNTSSTTPASQPAARIRQETSLPIEQGRTFGESFTFLLPLAWLRSHQDAILSDVQGAVHEGMLGHVHSLSEDEDLHFSLDAPTLQTPLVCELMNALSEPPQATQDPGYWSQRFASLFSTGAPVTVRGVFRLWPDHAASHAGEGADQATSNPPHVAEIHPIASVSGDGMRYDCRANIAPITYEGEQYAYKDPGRWGDMLSHDVETRVVRRNGQDMLELQTPQVGFNYWELHARIVDSVAAVPDGHRFSVHVLTPTRAYREVVRCFTVAGTSADRSVEAIQPDSEVTLAAIGRFDLRTLLASESYRGPIPVELCVFGINPPELRAARGRSDSALVGQVAHRRGRGRRTGGFYSVPGGESSQGSSPGGRYHPAVSESDAGVYGSATAAPEGAIIGNRRSHIYHQPGDARLPAPSNRVYFRNEAEAQAAGYRPARG